MSIFDIVEISATLTSFMSGIGLFVIWKIWPDHMTQPTALVPVLKTIVSIVFLASGFIAFAMQIVGVFRNK